MTLFSSVETLQALCKATGRYGMRINFSWDGESFDEICKAAPYLTNPENIQVLIDEEAILLFDSEDEMRRYFDLTVGDDGPTESNPYAGPAKLYALTCGPDGQILTENT